MLPGTCLSNNSLLAHALCQQHLTEHVIDFVGTSVVEIFTLQEETNTQLLAEVMTLSNHARTACVFAKQLIKIGAEQWVIPSICKRSLQLLTGWYQSLRNKASPELTKASV